MPPAAGRTGGRVSLTGEIIEEAPAPSAPASGQYGNSRPGTPPTSPGRPMPSGPGRPMATAYARHEAAPDNSRRNALLINLGVMLVLLLFCVGGGAWYWAHRTNPKAQVTRYIHAIQWLDWGVVYDLSATPPGNKSRHEFISTLNSKFDDNPLYKILARHSMETIHFDVAEPVIQGDEATVAVTRAGSKSVSAKSLQFTLTNNGGIWKIHPPGDNPLDLMRDPEDEKSIPTGLPAIPPGVGGMR